MKRPFLLLFIIVSAMITAQDFAPVGATWHYSESYFGGFPSPVEGSNKFESVKDTLIYGKLCRKIEKEDRVSCSDRPDTEYLYTSHDSVFCYDPMVSDFQLLYNFSAKKGDSWDILMNNYPDVKKDTAKIIVDSTDVITVNGFDLKRMYVTYQIIHVENGSSYLVNEYCSIIIENIGDIRYMFNYQPLWAEVCDGNFMTGLRCYSDNTIGLYKTEISNTCSEILTLHSALVFDNYCESADPYEIDTTYFWYQNDTLLVRNIKNEFCGDVLATYYTQINTVNITVKQKLPACLASCSYGYSVKIPMAPFDTLDVAINGESFKVIFNNLNTNTKDLIGENIQVYPNPVADNLTISMRDMEEIIILDVSGKVLLMENGAQKSIRLGSLNKGVYILKVRTKHQIFTRKIYKE